MIVVTGAAVWWSIEHTMPDVVTPQLTRMVWIVLAAHVGIMALAPLLAWLDWRFVPKKQTLSRRGVGEGKNSRSWKSLVAFDIKPLDTVPNADVIVFYEKTGKHRTLILPDDVRTRSLILRMVTRRLPTLEACDDQPVIVQPIVDIPGWLKLTMTLTTFAYAAAVGPWLGTVMSADLFQLGCIGAGIVGPATWLAAWWHVRHKRTTAVNWGAGFALASFMLTMMLAALWRP